MAWVKPKALRRGDRVAVVSPAGPLPEKRYPDLDRGLAQLRTWGLKPEVFPHAKAQRGYLAGTDAQRLGDLQRALDSTEHRAVFCVRGGYGCTRILSELDLSTVAKRPKLLIGYSDVTALLAALARRSVVGVHGPMLATSRSFAMGPAATEVQRRLLFDPKPIGRLPVPEGEAPHVLVRGAAEGELVGGNLSLVASVAGTPWQVEAKGRLLFLEDIDEKPYRVDRMLTQLRQCGTLEGVRGVILGDFAFGKSGARRPDESLRAMLPVFEDRLGALGVPVAYGFPFGHRARSWSLPVGVMARLDAPQVEKPAVLRLLESPVV